MELGETETIAVYSLLDVAIKNLRLCLKYKLPQTGCKRIGKVIGILERFRKEAFIDVGELVYCKMLIGSCYLLSGCNRTVKNLLFDSFVVLDNLTILIECNFEESYDDAQSGSQRERGIQRINRASNRASDNYGIAEI